jgi:hypothetical protein
MLLCGGGDGDGIVEISTRPFWSPRQIVILDLPPLLQEKSFIFWLTAFSCSGRTYKQNTHRVNIGGVSLRLRLAYVLKGRN